MDRLGKGRVSRKRVVTEPEQVVEALHSFQVWLDQEVQIGRLPVEYGVRFLEIRREVERRALLYGQHCYEQGKHENIPLFPGGEP
jgi:hypothetical protein